METKSPLQVQKMFVHLFPIGTEMQVLTIPSTNPLEKKVKSDGGCFGILTDGLDFPQGTTITAKIVAIKDGQPVFEPTAEWKQAKLPQKARVLFATPAGLALELETGGYVTYAPAKGMPEELTGIKDGQTVMVVGLKPMADQILSAAKAWIPEPADPSEVDPMLPWSDQKIKELMAQGSRKVRGKAKLGKVYLVGITADRRAKLGDDIVELRGGRFPQVDKNAWVRVVFIDHRNKIFVELIRMETGKK